MRRLTWTASADRRTLATAGCELIDFSALCRDIVAPARRLDARRESIANPAHDWLARVARAQTLAVLGVRIRDLDDLAALHGYVLEPALRSGTAVLIESEQRLTQLAPERFVDPQFEYPYTLERAIAAATVLYRGARAPVHSPPAQPAAGALDAEQRRAVQAHDGVVQVIAPAGSGKTTVLIERVRELLQRGTPAERILCATFNRDARVELQERLHATSLGSVAARTFHSIGWWLMREEGLARSRGVGAQLSLNQWKRLCTIAGREEGAWVDPADARAAISTIKLGLLATPREFRRQADRHENGPALAHIYQLYEQHQVEQQINDFDDLVLVTVRALREDPELRLRWQGRFRHVLVDEYQDIEPAQELLVRILAAPEDGFFCVGDEDQTLYGWRRASVRRIIELDRVYPGLQRISLAHNYRCPPEIVVASRRLIECNEIRFPKPILPDPARSAQNEQGVHLREHGGQPQAADAVARVLASRRRGAVVVLARTTNLLRTVALACADLGVKIAAPEQVFEPHGARGALEAYLRLCGDPAQAQAEDIALICRMPSRGLPFEAEERVAAQLRDGLSFSESLADLGANARQRVKLDDAGRILDVLRAMPDAATFISYLRGPGGLDEYFAEYEQTFAGSEQIELEVLEQSEREASGMNVATYRDLVQTRSDQLRAIRDDVNGLELTTIHRAKGRQWPEVHLFGCEERQLPHHRALDVSDQERAAGEGLEAERRLAYVAFTRAQHTLIVHTTENAASRFLTDAGLQPSQPYGREVHVDGPPTGSRRLRSERSPAPPGRAVRRAVTGEAGAVLAEAQRIGLAYALRTAPSRRAALHGAAAVIEQRLAGPGTTSARMTVAQLLEAIEQLTDDERLTVLALAAIDEGARLVGLSASSRSGLGRALLELGSNPSSPSV
jgi:DNA helicase-2/ATP-dependent DNA helicase PcrA